MIRSYEMNVNVNIFIEGIVRGEDESRITSNAIGQYSKLDGVHILRYLESAVKKGENTDNNDKEAKATDEEDVNTIKISPGLVEMIKIGENSTHMVFDIDMPTQSIYDTPYGSLYFQVNTKRIELEERAYEIILHMEYSLSHNDSHISDNEINIVANKASKFTEYL